jgi:REP element-mobilizing transposase RayT
MSGEHLNLDTPPNFRGLDLDLPVTFYTQRLPHWRQSGATYFVTFRLKDSLPKEKLDLIKSMRRLWEAKNPPPRNQAAWQEYAKTVSASVEQWLDQGSGACHFKKRAFADELARSILHFQDQRYFVSCYIVMPNHCHLVIRPVGDFKLEDVTGAMKGVSARFVNEANGRTGSLWQRESFDRIIRDEEHLYRVVQYIGNNPLKARLPKDKWFRWVHPDWEKAGWGFRDV